MSPKPNLANHAFSLRFAKLQAHLKATLDGPDTRTEVLASLQDRLILRLEGWIDGMADLHMMTQADLEIFRRVLAANRTIYRIKALALNNLDISDEIMAVLDQSVTLTIRKIACATG